MTEPKPPISPKASELPPDLDQALDRHAEAMDARMSEALRQLDEKLGQQNIPQVEPKGVAPSLEEAALDAQQVRGTRRRRKEATQTSGTKGAAPELPVAASQEKAVETPPAQALSAFASETTPESPQVSKLPGEAKTPKEEKGLIPEWTLGRLLIEIPEQGRFILTSPEGGENPRTHRYKREGGNFLNKKGKEKMDEILDRLNQGWTLTLVEEENETPKVPETAPENAEQHEFHPGDTWEKKTDEGIEYLTIQDVHGKNLTVRTYFQRKNGSHGQGAYGISTERLREQLQTEGYVFVPGMTVEDLRKKNEYPGTPEENVGQYEFRVLKNGEEQKYLAGDDTLFIVQKKKDGYYFVNDDESLTGPITQDAMRHQAEAERWRMIDQDPIVPEEEQRAIPVAEAVPEEPKEEPKVETSAEALQQKIDALKTEMAEFRYKYAEMDYEKTSAWKTLKGFFRNMTSSGEEDADTRYWASEYYSKLTELQNLELEQIKQEGLKGEELKERMAGVIQYYKYEQATALYNDRTQVRMERQSFVGKAWDKWEKVVKAYGSLSLSKKVLIGIGLAGVTVATGGVGGAAVLVLRRAMGATATAMATDVALAALMDKKEQKRVKKEIEDFEEKFVFSDDLEQTLRNYSGFLSNDIFELNQKLQKKKLVALVRKAAAANVGIFGGMILSSAASHVMAGHEGVTGSQSPEISAPEAASSAPAASVPEHSPAGVSAGETSPGVHPQEFKVSFGREDITAEDGKRGLWGILDRHLPQDMLPQAEKDRIIRSWENIIQQKLDHMSPAERAAVGFPKGDIRLIYADTQIDLGKLLTPDEIQSVMEGKSIPTPVRSLEGIASYGAEQVGQDHTAGVARPPLETSSKPHLPKPVFDAFHHGNPPKIEHVAGGHAAENIVPTSDYRTYLREHPGQISRYYNVLGKLRSGIFAFPVSDNGVPLQYDYGVNGAKLDNTQVNTVLEDMKKFRGGFLKNLDYDRVRNPLDPDHQMTAVVKFVEASEKAFGKDLAKIQDGETINHYTRRMAAAALSTGKEIKGFYKP